MALANDNTITYDKVLYDVNPSAYLNVTYNTPYGTYNYLRCYCAAIVDQNLLKGFEEYKFYDKPSNTYKKYCTDRRKGAYLASAVTYASTAVVIIVNQILVLSLRKFVLFEKLSSQTAQLMSLTVKLFVAQYVNTALLTLIINGNLNRIGVQDFVFASSQYFKFGFFTGEAYDYDVRWYVKIIMNCYGIIVTAYCINKLYANIMQYLDTAFLKFLHLNTVFFTNFAC